MINYLDIPDQSTVAFVWSFSNTFNDNPYKISRVGSPKREGGKGTNWKCTCPSFVNRGGKTCKHLSEFKKQSSSGSILNDKRFSLTEFGIKILKLDRNI